MRCQAIEASFQEQFSKPACSQTIALNRFVRKIGITTMNISLSALAPDFEFPTGAMTVDLEEWFHAHNLGVPEHEWEALPSRVEYGVNQLLTLLAETRTTATFFVLGWLAERRVELIRKISCAGHEIASHGYAHRPIREQTREEFQADIRRSKKQLENLIGGPIYGYRAPSYSITNDTWWALSEIRAAGFKYDSSIYPVRAPHGRYGIDGAPKHPFEPILGLREYPLPVVNILGKELPAATGAYLRLWPKAVHRLAQRQYRRRGAPLIINVHPWEFDPGQPRRATSFRNGILHYSRLGQTGQRLRDLLSRGKFTSIQQLQFAQGKRARREDIVWRNTSRSTKVAEAGHEIPTFAPK